MLSYIIHISCLKFTWRILDMTKYKEVQSISCKICSYGIKDTDP